jgi:hypothetical protein
MEIKRMTANELHESLKHNGGFTKHYNKTNMLIGTKITINDRPYKITANDLLLLNYLIGWQITDDGSLNGCYEANATIASRLNISINTLLDSYRKLKALNLISAQQVNGKLCRMFVDCDRLAELLNLVPTYKAGYEHILDTIDKKQSKKKGFGKQQDDDEECPF